MADELRKVALRKSQKPNIKASNQKPNQKALGGQEKAKSNDKVTDELHKVADEVRMELQIAAVSNCFRAFLYRLVDSAHNKHSTCGKPATKKNF